MLSMTVRLFVCSHRFGRVSGEWSSEDVGNWLASQGLTECCQDAFSKHGINGLVLVRLSEADVHSSDLGIEGAVAKAKLLAALEVLKADAANQVTPRSEKPVNTITMKDIGFRGLL
jgi:hypothetical protein